MLEAFFNPKSVAVIGASANPQKIGHVVLDNVIKSGFKGQVYPINLRETEILGLKAYPNVASVPGTIDQVVIVIPPQAVNDVLRECGEKGIKAAIIISAGFKEASPEGAKLEEEMKEIAKSYGITIMGPNCFGLIDSVANLNTSFSRTQMRDGHIALVSQSGAFCAAILDWAETERLGFSRFMSLGNEVDLTEVEILEFLADDPETHVILAYLEQIADGRRFFEVAKKVNQKKPMIILKSGVSTKGQKAASSHTGSLASSEEAVKAAFRQAGVIRAGSMEEMFDLAETFESQPFPSAAGVAVISNAGGPAVVATDAVEMAGLKMAEFSPESVAKLKEKVPPTSHSQNPLDLIGDAYSDRYDWALEVLTKDPDVHAFIVIVVPQELTDVTNIAKVVEKHARANPDKPFLVSLIGGEGVREGAEYLEDHNIPTFHFPEEAVRGLRALYQYGNFIQQASRPSPAVKDLGIAPDAKTRGQRILQSSKAQNLEFLSEADTLDLLHAYDFPFPKSALAKDPDEAVREAEQIGYPVVLKIVSPDIIHKTDVGGVRLNLHTAAEVREACQGIFDVVKTMKPDAVISGVLVEEMVQDGKEFIVGVKRDPSFGPLILVGLGGIYVEVLKDVSFRLAPLKAQDVESMLKELHSFPLLTGVRGEKPSDIQALTEAILRVSQLVTDHPEIHTLDLNPLKVLPDGQGVKVVDQVIGL